MTTKLISYQLKPGQYWLNTQTEKLYLVIGFVRNAQSYDYDQVLYRSDDMQHSHYHTRFITEWFGTNRVGEPRFVPYFLLTQDQLMLIRKAVSPESEPLLLKSILIKMFYGTDFYTALDQSLSDFSCFPGDALPK